MCSDVESQRVRPDVVPGYLRSTLPSEAPEAPHSFADIVSDVKEKIIPGESLHIEIIMSQID